MLVEVIQSEENRMKNSEESLRDLWDTNKPNTHTVRVLEGEEKDKGTESLLKEIMTGNSQNLGKNVNIYVHEAQ